MQPQFTIICPGCQQPFTPNNRGRRHHCSRACSNRARARSLSDRFWEKVDRSGGPDACWLWIPTPPAHGYGVIKWHGKSYRANRVAWELTNGSIPEGLWVLHNCPSGDNPRCCNPAHLYLGDVRDNARDMVEKGQSAIGLRHGSHVKPESRHGSHNPHPTTQGARHPHARLTDDAVRELRTRYASGDHRLNAFAQEFGVSRSAIYKAATGKGWKHLNLPLSDER